MRDLATNGVHGPFFHAMLRRGVALAPGPYEVLFPGLAHDEAVLAASWRPPARRRQRSSPLCTDVDRLGGW